MRRRDSERSLLKAIGPQPRNESKNFWLVVFFPKTNRRIKHDEEEPFRNSMFEFIESVDRAWVAGNQGKPYSFRALENFKPLDKYLELVQFQPHLSADPLDAAVANAIEVLGSATGGPAPPRFGEVDKALESGDEWIVPAGADWCRSPYDQPWTPDDRRKRDPKTMAGSLLKKLLEKANKCHASKLKTPCSEVHLLIAYDRAMVYCSPITWRKGVQEIAKREVTRARGGSWPFIRTILLIADEDDPRVHPLL
jgi:hypothetical protein